MPDVSMKQLLEAGVHFGHQAKRWNPKMKPYIFAKRKNIHIIDLQLTLRGIREVIKEVIDLTSKGGIILFVGTKKQSEAAVIENATKCGMPYIAKRWLGGTLTNFSTIQQSIKRLFKLDEMVEAGIMDRLPNKERVTLLKERDKKEKILGGIKDMTKLPDAMFVLDIKKDEIAVHEARALKIPVFAILDTNCDPDLVDFPIPGNDDAIRALHLFAETIAASVIEGKELYNKALAESEAAAAAAGGEPVEVPAAVAPEASAAPAAEPAAAPAAPEDEKFFDKKDRE